MGNGESLQMSYLRHFNNIESQAFLTVDELNQNLYFIEATRNLASTLILMIYIYIFRIILCLMIDYRAHEVHLNYIVHIHYGQLIRCFILMFFIVVLLWLHVHGLLFAVAHKFQINYNLKISLWN